MIELALLASLTCTQATFYGKYDGTDGQRTANGERFDPHGLTVAHPYLKMGTRIRVTNQDNMRQVIVRVNDRPDAYTELDLSYSAFRRIANVSNGRATVCYRVIA
jgi:rare lipoprotein A